MTAAVTDRELLELAAKAMGYTDPVWEGGSLYVYDNEWLLEFDPLTHERDTLKLAVTLRINIETAGQRPAAVFFHPDRNRFQYYYEDPSEQGMSAAVRRVVTLAAAELGRVRG